MVGVQKAEMGSRPNTSTVTSAERDTCAEMASHDTSATSREMTPTASPCNATAVARDFPVVTSSRSMGSTAMFLISAKENGRGQDGCCLKDVSGPLFQCECSKSYLNLYSLSRYRHTCNGPVNKERNTGNGDGMDVDADGETDIKVDI